MNPSIAIITPGLITSSIDYEIFTKCLDSVAQQTYKNYVHHIFVDGLEHFEPIKKIVKDKNYSNIRINLIEENIGKNWYAHRIYAASSFLVNQDIIVYLDIDNWLESEHLQSFIDLFNKKPSLQWIYSLRKIYDKDMNYICEDNCESLGKWPTFHNKDVYHIDTSCYAVKKETAVAIGHAWYGQWGADRQFFSALKDYFPNFQCTKQYTLCYRLGGNDNSVKKEFFIEGNKIHQNKYVKEFPWLKEEALEHVIGPGIRIQV